MNFTAITKWVPRFMRKNKPVVIATWQEPVGEWGIWDPSTGKSEIKGVMYSQNIIIEKQGCLIEHWNKWVPGPVQKRINL